MMTRAEKKAFMLAAKLRNELAATQEAVQGSLSTVTEAVVAKAERGERGLDGLTGDTGAIGRSGADGLSGVDGKDAVAVVDIDVDFDNHLIMQMEDGSVHTSESPINVVRGQTGSTGATGATGPAGADGTGGGGSGNLDGGRADSVYTAAQLIQGGGA